MSLQDLTIVDGVPVARMPSDVDAANAVGIGVELAARTPQQAEALVLDLSGTRYLDSVGIDMLLKLSEQLRRSRRTLRLALPEDAPLRRLLAIAAVDRSVAIHADVEEALAAGSEPSGSLA